MKDNLALEEIALDLHSQEILHIFIIENKIQIVQSIQIQKTQEIQSNNLNKIVRKDNQGLNLYIVHFKYYAYLRLEKTIFKKWGK